MPTDIVIYACLAVGLSSALVAGVFQSFSDFVMRSLLAATPLAGIEAMQLINRKVFRSVFLTTFLGLAPISIAFGIYAYLFLPAVATAWIMAGAAIYVSGVFLVTIFGNVPMNNRLDSMELSASDTEVYWQTYGTVWTRWNHVRTLASVASAVCFLFGSLALT